MADPLRLSLGSTLIFGVFMLLQMMPYRKGNSVPGVCSSASECRQVQPIAALELAPDFKIFRSIIDQGDPDSNRENNHNLAMVNTWLDFGFILSYWFAFVLLAHMLTESRLLVKVTATVASLAALFDVLEDIFLLRGLGAVFRNQDVDMLLPQQFSRIKWFLLGLTCLLLAVALFRKRISFFLLAVHRTSFMPRWIIRLLYGVEAIGLLVAACSLVYGSIVGFRGLLFIGVGTLSLSVAVIAALLLFTPIPSREVRLSWINYLYFIRVSLTLWLVMPLLALLDGLNITTPITLGIPHAGRRLAAVL
jgi:hypothetical protein